MRKLTAIVERNEETFFAFIKQIDGCVAGGHTYHEVKSNLEQILKIMIRNDTELQKKLKQGYDIRFEVDLKSVFELVPEINVSQLAKSGDINPGLLRQYVSGTKKASEAQAEKVINAIDKLVRKLNSITLKA
jgi:predicted RNase H-like HicB family nuclease